MTRSLHLLFKEASGPALPTYGAQPDRGGAAAVVDRAPEAQAGELQPKQLTSSAFPMAVLSVPCSPAYPSGAQDFYILCGCGWCSLPLVAMPALGRVRCEACDVRRQGRENFGRFAIDAAQRGCSTVLDIDGSQ